MSDLASTGRSGPAPDVTPNEAGQRGPAPSTASPVRLHLWEFQAVRDLVTIALVVGLFVLGYQMRAVTVPLLVALALAYLIEPVVEWLCRRTRLSRVAVVTILLSTAGTAALASIAVTVPLVVGQGLAFVQNVRDGQYSRLAHRAVEFAPEDYRGELSRAVDWLDSLREGTPVASDTAEAAVTDASADEVTAEPVETPLTREEIRLLVAEEVAKAAGASAAIDRGGLLGRIGGSLGAAAGTVASLLLGAVGLVLTLFLVPFYLWFFSVYWPEIVAFFAGLLPRAHRGRALELLGAMDLAISGFVRGRITIAFIMGVMFAIGWKFTGVPYAMTLGLFAGAISVVPYLGGVALPMAIGLLFFDQIALAPELRMAWWGILLWPTVVFTVVQTVEGYLLTPVIAGKATDLDPVTIVVAILAGGSLAGVYGMLLAIPAAACVKILLKQVVLPRWRAFARGEVSDPLPFDETA
jgi:predicted PurR-regulated permease PerM